VHSPPVICKYIEDTQDNDKECGRPLGFETDGNHCACTHSNQGNNDTNNAPLSLQNETEEKENEQDASSEQEAIIKKSKKINSSHAEMTDYFLRSVSVICGKPAKRFLRDTIESLKTMNRPPMTLRLRRKKFMSKMRP
jgi:hypothetical protein